MIEIPLTQGKVALIDDDDWPIVSKYRWFASKEGSRKGKWVAVYGGIKMHRLIMGTKEGEWVDHHNGNSLDNRRENLRLIGEEEYWKNNANSRKRAGTSSIYKGVSWDRSKGRWIAYVDKDYKRKFLGRFSSEVEAALAYNKAASDLFGEFALLNEVPSSGAV